MPCYIVELPGVLQWAICPDLNNRPEIPKRKKKRRRKKGVNECQASNFFQSSNDELPQAGKQRKLDNIVIVVQLVSKRKRR
jgi:hypothetical protein